MKMTKQQQGAALLVALIILLVVTMMGVSALKSGLFHERMAFNSQAEELSFHAAETAINGVIGEARTNGELLTLLMDTHPEKLDHCVTKTDGLKEGACTNDDTIDERDSLQSQANSKYDSKRPLLASDADYFKDYLFVSEGEGSFLQASMPFDRTNYQEWRKVGPSSGQFSDENGLLDYGVSN